MAGYGAYWLILEAIAEKITPEMTEPEQIFLQLSEKNWRKFVTFSPKKFQKFVKLCEKSSLFFQKTDKNNPKMISIYCPKLLKYRDEYTRKSKKTPGKRRTKSGATPDKVAPEYIETEYIETEYIETEYIETETERTKPFLHSANEAEEKQPEFYLTKKKKKLTGRRLESFKAFWLAFNYRKGRAEAADKWLEIPELTNALCKEIFAAAAQEAEDRKALPPGQSPKMPQGWITGRRWEDEIYHQENATQQSDTSAIAARVRVLQEQERKESTNA
jgi:hypothetical protein